MHTLNKYFNLNANEFMFNNSLIMLDDYYIMTYRYTHYNIKEKVHPWKIWSKGFQNTNKNIIEKNPELTINPKLFSLNKYRTEYDTDYFVDMTEQADINKTLDEIDTTGICIFNKTKDFSKLEIVYNNPILFKNYNHDTRICKVGDTIYLSYNGFLRENDKLTVQMLYRKLVINVEDKCMYVGNEELMFKSDSRNKNPNFVRAVEKNCIIDAEKNILYTINGDFKYILSKNNILKSTPVPFLSEIINYYGLHNIHFSYGTPIQTICLKEKETLYVGIGHVKVTYMNIKSNTKFIALMKNINWKKIKKHGKYVYFMFIFVYDKNYNITHISKSFIPTTNEEGHLPYTLVFPTGLEKLPTSSNFSNSSNSTDLEESYIISYGEGDEFSKIIIMTKSEICDLLIDLENINPTNIKQAAEDYEFVFWNVDTKKPDPITPISNYLVIGYYDQFNCGDDAFKFVFDYYFTIQNSSNQSALANKKFNSYFVLPHQINYMMIPIFDTIIVGGGDVVGDFFMKDVDKLRTYLTTKKLNIPLIAVSIGIPYLSRLAYLNLFDRIYLRNNNDYMRIIKNEHDDILGSISKSNIHYIPDLCFGLKYSLNSFNPDFEALHISKTKTNIGVFLCRPFFRKGYENQYANIIFKISRLLKKILLNVKNAQIYLIPFNIHASNSKECDYLINAHIKELNSQNSAIINIDQNIIKKSNYVEIIDALVGKMDFAICGRFHSHVFCINNNVPFVSLSCTRKCSELINQLGLSHLYSKIDCINDVPASFDVDKTFDLFKTIVENKEIEKQNLKTIHTKLYSELINVLKNGL